MDKNFEWNNETHTYELVSESLITIAKKNIDNLGQVKDMVITSEADLKVVKEARTEINKAVKEVATARKQMEALVLSTFKPQCIEIEKYGATIANELTDKINEYKGDVKEAVYKLTITSTDKKAIEKLSAQALAYGCVVKEG